MNNVISVIKDKNVFILTVEGKENPITYNWEKNELISFTNRKVKKAPVFSFNDLPSMLDKLVCSAIRSSGRVEYCSMMDKWFNYPELIDTDILRDIPKECPKGYINWLKDNNKKVSTKTLEEFLFDTKIKNFSKDEQDFFSLLRQVFDFDILNFLASLPKESRKKVVKIVKNSIKNDMWELYRDVSLFLLLLKNRTKYINYACIEWKDEYWNFLDTNRTIKQNFSILQILTEKDKYGNKIAKQQIRIKEIESLSNNTLTIIVPTEIEQLVDEGNQQNNCVGSHYNSSVARRFDFIYFIRKTKNPNKSYITNRATKSGNTVESLAKNNTSYSDKNVTNLIKEIDKKIKEIISREV